MPIGITFPPGQFEGSSPLVGPGLTIQLQSDFIGPFPSDAQWVLALAQDPEEEFTYIRMFRPCTGNITSFLVLVHDPITTQQPVRAFPVDNAVVHINARIQTNTGTIDSGSTTATWDSQVGLGFQNYANTSQQVVQGGFTAQDRALLTATDSRTQLLGELGDLVVQTASGPLTTTLANLFSRNSLDRLIFEEITSGPTCDPVRVVLAPIAQFAIAVRVTTVPEDIKFRTPDGEWAFPDLAVLRIFRGQELQFRRGIHEVTFETEAPWEWGANFLNKNLLGIAPPQTQIMVDWRQGCCGQVFIRHMP